MTEDDLRTRLENVRGLPHFLETEDGNDIAALVVAVERILDQVNWYAQAPSSQWSPDCWGLVYDIQETLLADD